MVKDIGNYRTQLEKLETLPQRFNDLVVHLKKQKNLNIAPDDLKTMFKALALAANHQKQVDEIIRLQIEIMHPMVKGSVVEARELRKIENKISVSLEKGNPIDEDKERARLENEAAVKGDRAFVSGTRRKRTKPGKKSKWTPEKEKELIERWYSLDGRIDKNSGKKSIREQKIETLEILRMEFPLESQDAVVQKLRVLKVKEIPDV